MDRTSPCGPCGTLGVRLGASVGGSRSQLVAAAAVADVRRRGRRDRRRDR